MAGIPEDCWDAGMAVITRSLGTLGSLDAGIPRVGQDGHLWQALLYP